MRLAFVFFALAVAACSNDEFTGSDAADDSAVTTDSGETDGTPSSDSSSNDGGSASDGISGDATALSFCKSTPNFFCDDFDENPSPPWLGWSTSGATTGSLLTLVAHAGNGQALQAKPGDGQVAYVTESVSNHALTSLTFDMQLVTNIQSTQLMIINATSETATFETNSSGDFEMKVGNTTSSTFSGDNNWHTFGFKLNGNTITVIEDNTLKLSNIAFVAPSQFTLELGFISASVELGGTIVVDNVVMD